MHLSTRTRAALLGAAVVMMFSIGAGVTACVTGGTAPAAAPKRPPVIVPASNLVIAYARVHPDPAISVAFADKLESGEIKVVVEKPREHAMASFGPHDGVYTLTFDPARLKAEPTLEEYEGVLSILSHEHAHYRQYVEGEMTNYLPRDGKMTEAQCTLTILVEIDAHGKACRDARTYGWETSVAAGACDRTIASLAEYFLSERLGSYPECKPVWDFYAGKTSANPAPKPQATYRKIPKRRTAGIYLPPP
ncbi:MAG TPA: hypothetical protein VL283_03315 [Candidatus Baltobacteraceae bacterium]|nr:hypothetical protein [Candidatus Baltobacteraceae bacterium]